MVLYPAVCHTFEIRPRRKITSDVTVMCSQVPVLFVPFALKSRVFIGESKQQCFPLCFICKSGEHPSLLLQIINIPYWILDDFDMANLSNLEIVSHPFMTVA